MSISAIASGAAGMHRAADRLEVSAGRVAQFGTGLADVDLTTELVETMMAEADFKAAATVVRAADRMAQTTIDILA
jgi:flagellar hook protein FlgE